MKKAVFTDVFLSRELSAHISYESKIELLGLIEKGYINSEVLEFIKNMFAIDPKDIAYEECEYEMDDLKKEIKELENTKEELEYETDDLKQSLEKITKVIGELDTELGSIEKTEDNTKTIEKISALLDSILDLAEF